MTRIVNAQYARARAAARAARPADRAGARERRASTRSSAAAARLGGRRSCALDARRPRARAAGADGARAARACATVGSDAPGEAMLVARPTAPSATGTGSCCGTRAAVIALELQRDRALRETERRLAGDLVETRSSAGRPTSGALRRRARLARAALVTVGEGADAMAFAAGAPAHGRRGRAPACRWSARDGGLACWCAAADDAAGGGRAAQRRRRADGGPPPSASVGRARHGRASSRARTTRRATRWRRAPPSGARERRRDGARPRLAGARCWRCRTRAAWSSTPRACWADAATRARRCCRASPAFIEANGRWGDAAERLGVHRHTLRHRIRRIEAADGPRPDERARPPRAVAGPEGPRAAAASAGIGATPRIPSDPRRDTPEAPARHSLDQSWKCD